MSHLREEKKMNKELKNLINKIANDYIGMDYIDYRSEIENSHFLYRPLNHDLAYDYGIEKFIDKVIKKIELIEKNYENKQLQMVK